MRIYTTILTTVFLLMITASVNAQVTNLLVNGSSTGFTMMSGDKISWSYNIPNGASTLIQIWLDVNGNGIIDAGDVLWQSFTQTDNDSSGQNGPPDMNSALGAVSVSQPVGLAPGKYIMELTQNNQSVSITGTVTPLTSPAYTISGKVTPPTGKSAANIFVQLKRGEKHQPNFWDALTDANGNYSIQMTSDTAGNPWRISLVSNPYPPYIISPVEDTVVISSNITGKNFSFLPAVAQIAGTVKDENGNIMVNAFVSINPNNSNNYVNYNTLTNSSGIYQLGLQESDLSQNVNGWNVGSYFEGSNSTTVNLLDGIAVVNSISPGDSIVKNLVIYKANSTISGTVTLNGIAPGFPIQFVATNQDSAQSSAFSDASTGNITFQVSNKIYNYHLQFINISQTIYSYNIVAHPGDSNVKIQLSTTPLSVKQTSGDVPKQFNLSQNYPNPFNPTTVIEYSLPKSGAVKLAVYDILGKEVASLVNENQLAGSYKVEFNADKLASGIYFYQIRSGNYISTKRMVLLK